MSKPRLLDLFCGAGGAAMGYSRAGFEVVGVDIKPQPHYPFEFIQADAMSVLECLANGGAFWDTDDGTATVEYTASDFDAIHASPPCQGYSIMNNLPWIRSRTYPLLILPVRELLNETGGPYVIENVAGAASKKNLEKLGLLEHRLRAGWLCGGMFGLPIYRHRYFETNWFWPQPGHPKHVRTRQPESSFSPRPRGVWEQTYETEHPGRSAQARRVNTAWRAGHDGVDTRRRPHLTERLPGTNTKQQSNGAQAAGAAVGHAAGWKIAAEAMGIDWMSRAELTQAIPPVMTEYIGLRLIEVLHDD